jgi:Ser/Thr protein kinase RdoA (MazF antagonist)
LDEQPLSTWGSGTSPSHAARAGGVVLTEGGAWTPAVLALLGHLEDAGFAGAPRVVGDGRAADGRMVLTYVPGDSPHPHAWPDGTVHEVGVLLRRLHDATAGFVPPAGAVWQPTFLREAGAGEVVLGHGDAAPWNIVGRDGTPEALVDWDDMER